MKNVFLVLNTLFVFISFSQLSAQEQKIEFDDGTEMSFEMLKQNPAVPIPLYIGLELGTHFFAGPDDPFNLGVGINGFYFINSDLMLAGRFSFSPGVLGIDFGADNQYASFRTIELGAYYSFAKNVKVKDGKLKLKSLRTGYNETTNYVMEIKEPYQRSWDVFLGLGSMRLPTFEYYAGSDLSDIGVDDISMLNIVSQSVTTLEIGISTRKFTRDVFTLDGELKGQSINNRWTAKLMIPIITRVDVLESGTPNEDVDYFDDQWSAMGFGIFYQGVQNSAMANMKLNGGYSLGLAMYPFLDSMPYLSIGYTIGFGLNDPEQLLD
jgi:hypothetical protein